jgi:hypothetical protein
MLKSHSCPVSPRVDPKNQREGLRYRQVETLNVNEGIRATPLIPPGHPQAQFSMSKPNESAYARLKKTSRGSGIYSRLKPLGSWFYHTL